MLNTDSLSPAKHDMLGKAEAETVVHPAWEAALGVENAHEAVAPSAFEAVVLITVMM